MKLHQASILVLIILSILGCSTMKISETHYYAVEDENNTNIYRLKVTAKSVLGEAKYQSGYFPSNAVDRAFGDIKGTGGTEDLQIQESLASEIRAATLKTTQNYLQVASNPESTAEDIQKALNIRRNILVYPSLITGIPTNARIIDYDPSRGIVLSNSESKMVFVFSSNPDNVVGNIKNFSESAQTALSVSKLAQITLQQTRNDVAEDEAILTVLKKSLTAQIQQSIKRLSNNGDADKALMDEQLVILNAYITGIRP